MYIYIKTSNQLINLIHSQITKNYKTPFQQKNKPILTLQKTLSPKKYKKHLPKKTYKYSPNKNNNTLTSFSFIYLT